MWLRHVGVAPKNASAELFALGPPFALPAGGAIMVDYLVRFLASLRSRRDCSRIGSGRPQRPTSEVEGASALQVAGRCHPRASEL